MGIDFDKILLALAGCPVIQEPIGCVIISPYPVIYAPNDLVLSHEICHVLAGKKDYNIFETAICVRNDDELYRFILNILYDWYHELLYSNTSAYLKKRVEDLKKLVVSDPFEMPPALKQLQDLYFFQTLPKGMSKIYSVIDLVTYADYLWEESKKQIKLHPKLYAKLIELVKNRGLIRVLIDHRKGKEGGPHVDLGIKSQKSSYYQTAVSKYYKIIEQIAEFWKKNKYEWINNYYGEINWKNLPGTFLGNELSLPVFRIFSLMSMERSIYLAIDRSGSTGGIKNIIMDTAVIITESLRMCGVPISILDIGVTDNIVNGIEEDLDLSWFTPMAVGGTPIGEVCSQIKDADHNSYLLIITDGRPNNWDSLASALNKFPGEYLSFIIGDSFEEYYRRTNKRALLVEPNTIIREMLNENTLN